jgi:hypothetical protein
VCIGNSFIIIFNGKKQFFFINRLILVSVIIAIKYHEDHYYKNTFYAKVGGISIDEFNKLEKSFLEMIEYSLFIDNDTYNIYFNKLE